MIDIDKIELRLRSGNVRPFNHLAWELIGEIKRLQEEVRWLRDTVCLLEDSRITNMSILDRPELFADVAEVFRQRKEDTHGHLPPFEGVGEE